MIEHLSHMHKALGSIPIRAKKGEIYMNCVLTGVSSPRELVMHMQITKKPLKSKSHLGSKHFGEGEFSLDYLCYLHFCWQVVQSQFPHLKHTDSNKAHRAAKGRNEKPEHLRP